MLFLNSFAFLLMDLLGILIFMGPLGLQQITLQIFSSLATFTLAPIPLFILMGELMFHSGIAPPDISMKDIWLSAFPFIICDMVAMVMIILWPRLELWLPGLMH